MAAAALALVALQAQLPDVLHREAGREHQVPLCSPLIPLSHGPGGFGWVLDTSSAFRLGLSTAASTPEPPALQDFLGLAKNTTRCSAVFCWAHGNKAETLQGKRPPSPFPASPTGRGSCLAQAAESFDPIRFQASLSLYTAAFPGSKIPHSPGKRQHAIPTCLSFPSCNKFCSRWLQPSPWGSPTELLPETKAPQTPPAPPQCSIWGVPRLRQGRG